MTDKPIEQMTPQEIRENADSLLLKAKYPADPSELRKVIGRQYGIPDEWIERLQGETAEQLIEDAIKVGYHLGIILPRPGGRPLPSLDGLNPKQIRDVLDAHYNNQPLPHQKGEEA